MIRIKKLLKKVDNKWKQVYADDIKSEDDLDGIVLKTTEGNTFKLIRLINTDRSVLEVNDEGKLS